MPKHLFEAREKNINWKGGIVVYRNTGLSKKDYVYLLIPGHHKSNKMGYVKRAIIVAENKLGRPLEAEEIVHHKDCNSMNDDPDNLEVMTFSEHSSLTSKKRWESFDRRCSFSNCNEKHWGRGYCYEHYKRYKKMKRGGESNDQTF